MEHSGIAARQEHMGEDPSNRVKKKTNLKLDGRCENLGDIQTLIANVSALAEYFVADYDVANPPYLVSIFGQVGHILRSQAVQQWIRQVAQSLEPAGRRVMAWWRWVCTAAKSTHANFIATAVDRREHVFPRQALPVEFIQLESWLRPRILASLPKAQREWVDLRAQTGIVDPPHTLLFYLYKVFFFSVHLYGFQSDPLLSTT